MVDLILIVVLIVGFLIGLKRGLVLQLVHLTGFIASFIIAYLYFDELAPRLRLWIPYPTVPEGSLSMFMNSGFLEDAYYRAIAFAMLFFGMKILLHILGSMLDFLADLPILRTVNGWLGGVLGFVEVYLVIFLFLYIAALVPMTSVQSAMEGSLIAKAMVEHTPVFSEKIREIWIAEINTKV
ncbi:CvpA family protein [Pseudalkalibacillus decolorationis]|uniref:CvpA family protein n=1 Tax=Pseudalkalibacillus decolorationis TaxID=163879 RepID=UPI00214822B3|nr:CvpA family protein [Pseudalkalibacillus decolorationis]